MNVEQVLQMVDEFGLMMRDAAKDKDSITPAAMNQQRERLHDAIRRLADPSAEASAIAAERAIAAASVDRTKTTPPSGVTTDATDPRLGYGADDKPVPQNPVYLVLSDEERAKGFVRPVRDRYLHVGLAGPKYPLQDLTQEQAVERTGALYAKYEPYPRPNPDGSSAIGRYWTRAQLDAVGKGCQTVTTMGSELAETYAREPGFYGSTYCVHCSMHRPVGAKGEFVWDDGTRVGT